MLKVEGNQIKAMLAVEVKGPRGKLTYEQKVWREILKKAGVKHKVEVVE